MWRAQPACAVSVASMVVKPVSRIATRRSTTQSACCSIDTAMFDSTDGLPGPVIMNRLGKPATVRPRCPRPVHPDVVDRLSAPAGDGMNRQDGAGHGVEPGGEHDHIDVDGALVGLDAGRRDRPDRLLPQIDQGDVGPVVGRVVVGLQAWALGAERMVARRERLGRLGILHDRRDPLAQQVGHGHVALDLPLVGPQLRQHDDEISGGQRLLETLAAFGVAELPAELGGARQGHAGERLAGLRAVVRPVLFQQGDAVRRLRAVVRREREVRGALEHREMGRLLGDHRDRLDARRSRADDGDALAGECDALARPAAGEVISPLKSRTPSISGGLGADRQPLAMM